jgi:S-adenosylmethionine hydrolase
VKHRFISFLSDFGLTDDFVGTCHGVIKRIAPDVAIIDVTHGIAPQAVLPGALILRNTLRYLPSGVHLAVVDPGVGGTRRPLIIRDANGELFVGPDNGLLVPPLTSAESRAPTSLQIPPTRSSRFRGRSTAGNLFSPAAAHLALGVDPAELGPPLSSGRPGTSRLADSGRRQRRCRRERALRRSLREHAAEHDARRSRPRRCRPRHALRARARGRALLRDGRADVRRCATGEIVLYEDSYRNIAIAINRGSAADMFAAQPGQHVLLHLEQP